MTQAVDGCLLEGVDSAVSPFSKFFSKKKMAVPIFLYMGSVSGIKR